MIMDDLEACNDSVRSLQQYERKAATSQKWPSPADEDLIVTFDESDINGLGQPNNNPLVIELMIADYEVGRILIDTCSSVYLVYKGTLKRMDIKDDDIKYCNRPLTGFANDTKYWDDQAPDLRR